MAKPSLLFLLPLYAISISFCPSLVQTKGLLNFHWNELDPREVALIECTIQVIEQYSQFRNVILVEEYEPEYAPENLDGSTAHIFSHTDLLIRLQHPVLLMDEDRLEDMQGFFVLFTYFLDEAFTHIFSQIRMSKNNRFLIVLLGNHRVTPWQLYEVFFQFLKLHLINVVVLLYRADSVHAYDCHPFGKNVSLADIWHMSTKRFEKGVDLYDEMSKMKNMHGFKIKCLTKNKPPDSVLYMADNDWVSSGLGVNLLREIYQKMNFTPDIIFPQPDSPHNVDRFGYDISPNMNSLIIGALTIREVDLAFGVFSHLLYQSPTTEFSTSAAEECFTFAVPAHAGRPPSIWSDFINEFRPMVWFLLGVTFVVNVFVWYLATKWQLSKDSRILSSHLGEDRKRILVSTTQGNGDTGNSGHYASLGLADNAIESAYRNPLHHLKGFLEHLRRQVKINISHMRWKKPDERVVFRNNRRTKLNQLVSNAQTLLACRSRNPRITSKDSSEDSKITLEQVIFFEIALTLGIPMLNKVGNRWLMRFLVIQYVFFCLITSQAYLGSLGSFMTYPDEKGQINTPEELYDRNLKLTGVLQSKRILERAFSKQEILKKLSKRYKFYSGYYDDLMLDIHHGRNTSTFATSRFLQFYINNNHILKNNPDSIYLFPKCTVTSYSSPFLFQKGSPFIDPINKILHRIIESGITKKWYESSTPRKMVSKRDPVHRLDLSQILGVFVILLMLLGISMVVFLLELVTHSYYKRNEKNNL